MSDSIATLFHNLDEALRDDLGEDQMPVAQRKFGPAFARPCLRWSTIICMDPHCQEAGRCRLG